MSGGATRRFSARRSEWDSIRAFVVAQCSCIEEDVRQRALLLIEELFANSVLHGYGGDSDQPVWLTVEIGGQGCRLVYQDCAPPYNPFLARQPDLESAAPEDRPVGGLGIVFLHQLTSGRGYERLGERNVIRLELPLAAKP